MLDRLREKLSAEDAVCVGRVFRKHAVLEMPESERHLWSPQLHLRIDDGEDTPFLAARFSPRPNVWTFFMAIYGVLFMIGLFGCVVGMSQWSLGRTPWAFAILPASLAMGAFVYGAAFVGQGMSAEQMYELRAFAEKLGEAEGA